MLFVGERVRNCQVHVAFRCYLTYLSSVEYGAAFKIKHMCWLIDENLGIKWPPGIRTVSILTSGHESKSHGGPFGVHFTKHNWSSSR